MTPTWPLTPLFLKSHLWLSEYYCVNVPCKYIEVCGYTYSVQKLKATGQWPIWPLNNNGPHISKLRSHVRLYRRIYIASNSHKNTSKHVHRPTVIIFFKNLNQRSMTPKWPLTPTLMRSHVWLNPRISVSTSHGNTLMYADTVITFAKLTTRYSHIHTDRMSDHIWSHSKLSSGKTKISIIAGITRIF